MKKPTIGIIGGTGKMGTFFQKVFDPHASEILLSSLDTKLSNRELVERSQVVLISVPIRDFSSVVEKLVPYFREDQLLMDLTSLKEMPCESMLRTKSSVIGMHPLFGPTVSGLSGQTIALCLIRPGKWKDWLFPILEKENARLFEIDPKTHDQNMALVQSLAHFIALIFSDVIRKEKNLEEILPFATPVFRMLSMVNARILSQSPELYADMQTENPFVPELLSSFTESMDTLSSIVLEKDKEAFVSFFKKCEKHFSCVKEQGQRITQKWVEDLKKETI